MGRSTEDDGPVSTDGTGGAQQQQTVHVVARWLVLAACGLLLAATAWWLVQQRYPPGARTVVVAGRTAIRLDELVSQQTPLIVRSKNNQIREVAQPDSGPFRAWLSLLNVTARPDEPDETRKRFIDERAPYIGFQQAGATEFRIFYTGIVNTVYVYNADGSACAYTVAEPAGPGQVSLYDVLLEHGCKSGQR